MFGSFLPTTELHVSVLNVIPIQYLIHHSAEILTNNSTMYKTSTMVYVLLSVHVMNVLSQDVHCGSTQSGLMMTSDDEDYYYTADLSGYSSISIKLDISSTDTTLDLYDSSGHYLVSCSPGHHLKYEPNQGLSHGGYKIRVSSTVDSSTTYTFSITCTTSTSYTVFELHPILYVILAFGLLVGLFIILWFICRKKKLARQVPIIDATEFTSMEAQREIDSKSVESEPIIMNGDDDKQAKTENVQPINQGMVTIVSTEDGNFEYAQSNDE